MFLWKCEDGRAYFCTPFHKPVLLGLETQQATLFWLSYIYLFGYTWRGLELNGVYFIAGKISVWKRFKYRTAVRLSSIKNGSVLNKNYCPCINFSKELFMCLLFKIRVLVEPIAAIMAFIRTVHHKCGLIWK